MDYPTYSWMNPNYVADRTFEKRYVQGNYWEYPEEEDEEDDEEND